MWRPDPAYNKDQCFFLLSDGEYYCNENTNEKQKESKLNIHRKIWDSWQLLNTALLRPL